jgi:hypothetical protein
VKASLLWVVCHERRREYRRRATVRDEGGPFGFGDQEPISSHRKLLRSKNRGGERCGNPGTMIPTGTVERGERKRTAAEASKAD